VDDDVVHPALFRRLVDLRLGGASADSRACLRPGGARSRPATAHATGLLVESISSTTRSGSSPASACAISSRRLVWR
jgi:hypothetical protein